MKYETVDSKRKCPYVGQTFTDYVKDYILNPGTNELEELPKLKNVQAYIQSFLCTCLEASLEKFLPKIENAEDVTADYTQRLNDLAVLGDYMELAEEYREKLNLPDTASVAEIYAAVDKSAQDLKCKLDNAEVKDNGKSETPPSNEKV